MQNEGIVVHTDGGSRGNPGPAAGGFVVEANEKVIYKSSKFLGNQTNNFAEYSAVILALEWISSHLPITYHLLSITFLLDSELVVKQINGLYKVKDENLRSLYYQVVELIKRFNVKVIFKHVPREKNKEADSLVNQELDKNH